MTKHKVHFFKIDYINEGLSFQGENFSDICKEIVAQEFSVKTLELPDDKTYRLNYFVQNGDYFEGKIVKFRNNNAITGSLDDDELTDFTLDNGKKFTEVTHFIYSPSTDILSFEYNHHGTFYSTFMRYINSIQLRYKADAEMFKATPLMHPDVLQKISSAEKIKALTIGLPVAKLPDDLDENNLLKGLSYGSKLGNPGQISLTLTGASRKGDRSPLMSTAELMNALSSNEIDLGMFGKVTVDVATEFGAEVINLLENKIESSKNWTTPITNDNAERWFDDIRSLYQINRDLLLISAGQANAQ